MKSKYLVTGATGFVGANIVRVLVKKKEDVSIIVRDKKLNWRLGDIASKIEIYESDILNHSLEDLVRKIRPDYVFHLAAYGVLSGEKDPNKMTNVNVKGTMNLIKAVTKIPFKLLINAGTFFEYGGGMDRLKESDSLSPINEYGKTKAIATLYAKEEGLRNNLPIITFRLFSPFGYFEDKNRLIPSTILSSLKNETIKVSVPTSVRDFIFIDDVVMAYLKAAEVNFSPGEIINIGSGSQRSIKEVVTKILKITKSNSRVEWRSIKQNRFIEPERWEADISKARRVLEWKPRYPFDRGLEKTIEWFRKNQDLYANAAK